MLCRCSFAPKPRHKLSAQPRSFTGPPCPQFQPVTTLVLAHCLERSSLCSSRCMLHFLLLPLLLSACYERPGSLARASHALCVSKRIIIARAITFHVPSFWAAVWLYLPVPATRRPRTLLPRVKASIRDHICCFASRLLCFHQHHRRSKPDNECATTCESPAAPPVIAPQCPESTSTSVTTTLDPTVRTNPFLQSLPGKRAFPHHVVCLVHGHSFITDPLRCPACVCRLCVTANELLAVTQIPQVDTRLQQNSFSKSFDTNTLHERDSF